MIDLLKKVFLTFGYTIFAVVLAWLILFVSISRTSLSILAQNNGCESKKSQLIALADTNGNLDGENVYKLPEVTTLPTHPLYGFKVIRDYLWLTFSASPKEKAQISLFLADKKMAEMYGLIKLQQARYALEAANGALEKLKFSQQMTEKIVNQPEAKSSYQLNLSKAGLAYVQMIESLKSLIDIDQTKYEVIEKGLNDFNQNQNTKIIQETL